MADDKTTIYRITYEVDRAIASLQSLETRLSKVESISKKLSAIKVAASGESAVRTAQQRASVEERAAKEAIRFEKARSNSIRRAGMAALQATKQRAREEKRVADEARKVSIELERQAKAAQRVRDQFKKTFLSLGRGSTFGMGSVVRNALAATAAYVSLYRVIQKIGEAKDRYLRFDELTTAAMTISHAGDKAFEHGSRGAERYRDAIREAADDVKAAASEMADSALFWAKAGQTNANTIVELSKIGTIFARANRDAANNVLDQARANDILSDALQLFRKDTSTTEKAKAEAIALGDKLTAAANASNIVVEQLFDYSKKVAGLFKTGEVADEEIMAIAASLASAGLKEESGVHVRRMLTRIAMPEVQKLLKSVGIGVEDDDGAIRSFGDIFGELQEVLKEQKPLERMKFLKDLFGQRAVATAAAMAGLQEEGLPAETSIKRIIEKIDEGTGIAQRNQEQWLKTSAGRVQALTSVWGNAFDKMLADSGLIEKLLSGLEGIDPEKVFAWMQDTMVPALESFGVTMRDTVIPGVQMAASSLSDWFSPALSAASSLLGMADGGAQGLSDTITTLVKLWVKWRIAMLAIRGLRMVDWLATFTKQALAAATATKGLQTATAGAVVGSKAALATMPAAFTGVGVAIIAAIAAWGLYDAIVGPVEDALKRLDKLKTKYGKDLERLKPGKESYEELQGHLRDAQTRHKELQSMRDMAFEAIGRGGPMEAVEKAERDLAVSQREIDRLREIQAQQIKGEYGVGTWSKDVARTTAWGQTITGPEDERWVTESRKGGEYGGYEGYLAGELEALKGERARLESEREKTFDQFVEASKAGRDDMKEAMKDTLESLIDQMKDNEGKIGEYTDSLNALTGQIAESESKKQAAEQAAEVVKERKAARGRAFKGGKTKEINPFATPLFSGLDEAGNRIINLALQKGNAAEYFQKSPEARESLKRELKAQKNITNVYFGDQSVSVTAKSDAKPQDIAKVVKDEFWKIGRRNQQDVQRILGATVPPEI